MLKNTNSKQSKVLQESIEKYHEHVDGTNKFVEVFYNLPNLRHSVLYRIMSTDITKSKYKVVNITSISNNSIAFISHDINNILNTKYSSTGMFLIELSNGDKLIHSEYINRQDGNYGLTTFTVGKRATVRSLVRLCNKASMEQRKDNSLKFISIDSPGWYKVSVSANGDAYIRKNTEGKITTPVIHPKTKVIYDDMKHFFRNIKLFKRYGQPGVRKILLVGPPGTGKTTIFNKIIRDFKDEYAVTSVVNIYEATAFLEAIARSQQKGILLWEDAETSMIDSSEVLNFLDGVNQPKSRYGTYVIMSTNNPQQIAGRILKRPGRIDRYVFIDALKGEDVVDCFNLYIPKNVKLNKEFLISELDSFTGAQIKEIALSVKLKAASYGTKINEEIVHRVITDIKTGYNEIDKFTHEMDKIMSMENKFGFTATDNNSRRNSYY